MWQVSDARWPIFDFDPADDIARRVGWHDEGGNPLFAGGRFGRGEDEGDGGILAAGDELLAAGDDVVVALPPRPRCEIAGIGPALRLGEAEGGEHAPLGHRSQEALFLFVRAVEIERRAADRVVAAHDGRAGGIAGGDLLERERERDDIGTGTAPFLGHRHAEEAETPHLPHGFLREARVAVPFGRARHEPLARELAREVPGHRLLHGRCHRRLSSAAPARAACSTWPAMISFCTSLAPS